MSDLPKKNTIKIRTFAGDLEKARKHRKQTAVIEPLKTPVKPPTPIVHITKVPSPAPVTTPKQPKKAAPETELVKIPELKIIPKVKTVPQTKIPAFHELSKHSQTPPKKSEVSEPKAVTRPHLPNAGYGATIITDTKNNDFNFFSSVKSSFSSWMKEKKTEQKKKEIPKYSVPDTQRRKGIIQKATSRTATSFVTKNETLREQIKKRQLDNDTTKPDSPETTWSPFTDTGYPLLEEPAPVTITSTEQKKDVVPSQKNDHPQKNHLTPEPKHESIKEEVSYKKSTIKPRWSNSKTTSPLEQKSPVVTPKVTKEKLPKNRNFDTNAFIAILLLVFILLAAIVLASQLIAKKIPDTSAETLALSIEKIKPLVKGSTIVPIVLDITNINDLSSLIESTIETAPTGIVELVLVTPNGSEVTSSYIFELLRFRTIPNLKQSLTATRFISIDHNTPTILLQFVDINTVHGSLLQWEKNLPVDFVSLYKIPSDTSPIFKDIKINNKPTRILKPHDDILLLYSIINDNTLLISSNTSDFIKISEQSLSQ